MHLRALLFLAFVAAFQSPPSGTISGRVTFEDSGEPAANLVIRCSARSGSLSERVVTDSDGHYQCKVPAGVYRVRAELSRLDTLYLSQTYGVSQPGDEGRGIRVRANARADVPFVLRRSGSLTGWVVDDQGQPVRNAVVTAYRDLVDDPVLGSRPVERAASIGDRGTFSISGLFPGVYRLRAEPPLRAAMPDQDGLGLVPTWYPGATEPRQSLAVQINGDDLANVDLALVRSRRPVVSGVLVRADGSPAVGSQINLVARVGNYQVSSSPVTTGAKGDFTFPSVEPGDYEIMAGLAGDHPESVRAALVVGDSDASGLVISLRAAVIRGRVVLDGGDFPAASPIVVARGGVRSRSTTTPRLTRSGGSS